MSGYRRRLAAIANKMICGVDFSKQPDNELWYVTINGQKIVSISPVLSFGGQELTVLSHSYENGIGKITYNGTLVEIGSRVLQDPIVILSSMPKKVQKINDYCCFGKILILQNKEKVNLGYLYLNRATIYVQPNCAKLYKEIPYNIIEKKI